MKATQTLSFTNITRQPVVGTPSSAATGNLQRHVTCSVNGAHTHRHNKYIDALYADFTHFEIESLQWEEA